MRKLTVLALAMVLGFSVAANAERPLVLRLGHPMAPGNNVTVGYEKFKQLVEEKAIARSVSSCSPTASWAVTV